jgi:hypothetical protein
MKRALFVAVTLLAAAPAQADITHKIQSSIQLNVDAAASAATRIGTSYSVSGSGVSTTDGTTSGAIGGLGSVTNGIPSITTVTATQATDGAAFSFSQSYLEGDSTSSTSTTVTNGVVGSLPLFGSTTTSSGGVAGGCCKPGQQAQLFPHSGWRWHSGHRSNGHRTDHRLMRWFALLVLLAGPAAAVPVVPNFRSGTMTSRTESTTQVTETIRSINYGTGYTYSASGTNVQHSGTSMLPGAKEVQEQTINGVTSSWTGLALEDKPTWQMTTPGASFQFVESYSGPGLTTQTDIQRTTTVQSVTDTTSVFGP